MADPAGGITLFTWTAAGRLASRTLPSGRTERWAYDAEGNLVGHTDPDGHRTMVEYTWFDLPAAVTGPDGARRVFGYDTELRLVAVTDAAGLVWRYERTPPAGSSARWTSTAGSCATSGIRSAG